MLPRQAPEGGAVAATLPAQMWLERTRLAWTVSALQVDVRMVGAFMTRRSGWIGEFRAAVAAPDLNEKLS